MEHSGISKSMLIADFISDGLEIHERRGSGYGPDVSIQSALWKYAYAGSYRRIDG